MAGAIASFPAGVQSSTAARATSAISTNSSVRTSLGAVLLVTDVMVFPAGSGAWLQANQSVFVNGVQTIGSTSLGESKEPPGPIVGPMTVVQGDSNVHAM
ncbi:MAG: hypothetical protein HC927_02640 [Deltaproteobacteria bacterium]|nr:hypothetical protein [Deltaproteobacteria bacterium]